MTLKHSTLASKAVKILSKECLVNDIKTTQVFKYFFNQTTDLACILDLAGSFVEISQSLHVHIDDNNTNREITFKDLLISEDRVLFEDLLKSLPQIQEKTLCLRITGDNKNWDSYLWSFTLIEDLILAKASSISETMLAKTNERFSAIANNIPVMLSFFDKGGNFEWVNKKWTSETGWDLESMRGHDMMAEFYPDPKVKKEVLDFMLSGSTDWRDFYLRRRDSSYIHTTWANVLLTTGQRIGIGQNISLRKALEKDLLRVNEELAMALEVSGIGIIEFSAEKKTFRWS